MRCRVTDDGIGIDAEAINKYINGEWDAGRSFALKNIHDRIQLEYGKEYGLSIQGSKNKGSVVRLLLPDVYKRQTIDGLIHISQVTNRRLEKVEEELRIGDKVTAKIMEVNLSLIHIFSPHTGKGFSVFPAESSLPYAHLRAADKLRHKKICRMLVQVHRCINLLDVPILHHDDSGSHGHGLCLVVRNINEGRFQAPVKFEYL